MLHSSGTRPVLIRQHRVGLPVLFSRGPVPCAGAHPAITPGPLSGPVRGRGRLLRGGPGYGLFPAFVFEIRVAEAVVAALYRDYERRAGETRHS
jgi:hypothetical protein